MQAAVELPLAVTLIEKLRVANFNAVVKHLWQPVKEMPQRGQVTRAKSSRKLKPVLPNSPVKRCHPLEKIERQIVTMTKRCLVRNGGRKFKAEAKIIIRLRQPAVDYFGFWQGVQRQGW